MNRNSDILTVENQPRETSRHHHVNPRHACKKEKSKPRFRISLTARAREQDPADAAMRVLLRDGKTMKFFGSEQGWTNDPKQARNFHTGWWATVCALTMNLRHLVIHYEFNNDRYNLHIPVLDRPRN